jgi:flagellar FliL protein
MNSKFKSIVAIACAVIVSAAGAGAAVWWFMPKPRRPAWKRRPKRTSRSDGKPLKYVTLEKVIVMLRRGPGEAEIHYLSTDLVLSVEAAKEKETKENLPLLRSLAVRTLSAYTMAKLPA